MFSQLAQGFTIFLAVVISLTIHETAHAYAAKLCGDNTAESMGRLSLNPLVHIDIFGTIIFPLLLAFTTNQVFGWAKPVPVDPRKFKNRRWDHFLVAAAGPMSNVLLCVICAIIIAGYSKHEAYFYFLKPGDFFFPLIKLVNVLIQINALLAVFNLIPLPPLDGATIFGIFLPAKVENYYYNFVRPYGTIILLILVFSGGMGKIIFFTDVLIGFSLFLASLLF